MAARLRDNGEMESSAWKSSIRRFVITEKAPSRAFSWLKAPSVLNVKAVVAAFNQEKALVGAFSVITNLRMELFQALICFIYLSNTKTHFKKQKKL